MSEALARELARMGIRDPRVLRAIAVVPRDRFVPPALAARADGDHPLPIGHGQTISQPYMVGWMSEALRLRGAERVLEVGTGSGYQAAILARLCGRVLSFECIPELASAARERLAALGVSNVEVRLGDGALGAPGEAPFDGIMVTAAAEAIPPALLDQLAPGGRMVIPIGPPFGDQYIHLVERDDAGGVVDREGFGVRFVPLRSGATAVAVDCGR